MRLSQHRKTHGFVQVDVEIVYEDLDDLESDDDGHVNSVRCTACLRPLASNQQLTISAARTRFSTSRMLGGAPKNRPLGE